VPEPAFRFLEYVFLAFLYLFLLRVLRAVWVELREPALAASRSELAEPAPLAAGPPTGRHKARGAPGQLAVLGPDQAGAATYPLADELTIGRAPGCTVPLESDSFVSQFHARVFRRGDEYWVEDLGSTNGTLVNGRRVNGAVPLQRGDRLQLGRSVLELQK